MKIQNKGAVLVQIAPLFISQPRNQNQSIERNHDLNTVRRAEEDEGSDLLVRRSLIQGVEDP